MKKPYITQFERQLIVNETLTGDLIMLRFRWLQLLNTIEIQLIVYLIRIYKNK